MPVSRNPLSFASFCYSVPRTGERCHIGVIRGLDNRRVNRGVQKRNGKFSYFAVRRDAIERREVETVLRCEKMFYYLWRGRVE